MKKFQLVVVGAGAGGVAAAKAAANLGASVAIIDSKNNFGKAGAASISSKAFIHAARQVYRSRSEAYGLEPQGNVDFSLIRSHILECLDQTGKSSSEAALKALGIKTYNGQAKFISSRSLKVGKDTLKANRIIIATGTAPLLPQIDGLSETPYYTDATIFEIEKLPQSLVVVGGGPQGIELAEAFAMLDTQVTLFHDGDRLLPEEEPEVSVAIKDALEQLGIMLIFQANIQTVNQNDGMITLKYELDNEPRELSVDSLLIAAGRRPNLDLDLDKAGVKSTAQGIIINQYLATSQPYIYAVGDCNGASRHNHIAVAEAEVATRNALMPGKHPFDRSNTAWVSFTTPEIGRFGQTELQVKQANYKYKVNSFDYSSLDRAVTEQETGFIKLITEPNGSILGATVVGAMAGELIGQLSLLHACDGRLSDLTLPFQPYPTYSHGLKQAAEKTQNQAWRKGWRRKLLKAATLIQR